MNAGADIMKPSDFNRYFDSNWLDTHVRGLFRIERKQTFSAYNSAAKYVLDLLNSEGFECEKIDFVADGKTAYQDKCSPIGWDCTNMTLSLCGKVPGISNPVLADFNREPIEVVKHSVSTPPGGIDAPVFTESQMKAGADVTGAFVLLDPDTRPFNDSIRPLLDLGAIGWISDFAEKPFLNESTVYWANAATETNSWHVTANDRPFISFQISPKNGAALRAACSKRAVKVHVESDGHRHESTLPAVTALLPGEDKRELWLLGHMYEPLIDDNSNGIIGSIEILKALRAMQKDGLLKLKYSVRVVFASEMYGFAAFAEKFMQDRGLKDLKDATIGGIVMDGLFGSSDKTKPLEYSIRRASDFQQYDNRAGGFAGNLFLEESTNAFCAEHAQAEIINAGLQMYDDMFLSEATVGLRTIWIAHGPSGVHHSSKLDEAHFDLPSFARHLTFCGDWIRRMVAPDADEIRAALPAITDRANERLLKAASGKIRPGSDPAARMRFLLAREASRIRALSIFADIPEIEEAARSLCTPELVQPEEKTAATPWFDYSSKFFFSRLTRGFPHDLAKLPNDKRFILPEGIIYSTLASIVSRLTPGISFANILREVEWEFGIVYSEALIRKYLLCCIKLAAAGYLEMKTNTTESAASLTEALRKVGVKEGDTLLVHSALASLGYIPGGAEEVLKAVENAVGPSGTLMAPAFALSYIGFEGTVNTGRGFRPYDTRPDGKLRDAAIWTGTLPKVMTRRADSFRSGHPTHEWVAVGANAKDAVAGHGFNDPPAGPTSPMHYAHEHHGSVVFLGCGLASNTFIHYCETLLDVPCLAAAIYKYIDGTGKLRTGLIEKHLPGNRDFYAGLGKSKFYDEAIRRGLKIDSVPFGVGTIYRISLDNLYDVTMAMLRENPDATC